MHGNHDATAASMQQLSRTGATLVCLTPTGVTTVAIPFDPPLERPDQLWPRLSAHGAAGPAGYQT